MIVLRGGPMNGWITKPNAPVLRPDWKPLPPTGFMARLLRRRAPVGRYVVRGREAFWRGETAVPTFRERVAAWWASVRPLFWLLVLALALVDLASAGVLLTFNIGQVFLELLADGARLRASIEKEAGVAGDAAARTLSQRLSAGLTSVGRTLTQTGKSLTQNVTLPIVGLGAAIFKVGTDFDTAMRQIVALTDVTADEIGDVREQILALAPALGKSPQELAEGFYFLASAGFDTAEAMEVLESTAKASAAGLGTTADISKVVGAAINAFGRENLTASDAVDQLLRAINKGTAEAPEFAGSLGNVVSSAALVGATFADTTAAIAGMTIAGVGAEEATTSLNRVLLTLLKTTPQEAEAFESVGLSAAGLRSELREKGLLSVLRLLDERFGDNETAIAAAFGEMRAFRGVTALLGLDSAQLAEIFTDVTSGTQNIGDAFADTEGPGRAFDRAITSLQVTLIRLGDDALPVIAGAFETFGGIVATIADAFRSLPEPVRALIVRFAGLAAAIGPVLFVTGKLATGLGAILGPLGRIAGTILPAEAALRRLGPAIADAITRLPGLARMKTAVQAAGTKIGNVLGSTVGKVAGIAMAAVAIFWFVSEFNRRRDEIIAAIGSIGDSIGDQIRTGTTAQLEQSQAALRDAIERLTPPELPFGIRLIGPNQLDALKGVVEQYNAITAELNRRYVAQNQTAEMLAAEGGQQIVDAYAEKLASLPTALEKNAGLLRAAADRYIRRPIGERLVLLGADGIRRGAEAALGVAQGIRDKRDQIKSALSQLREDLKNALRPSKEIGQQVGRLLSRSIRLGLKSGDAAARAQAEGTRALIEARLLELIEAGGEIGKNTLERLAREMKSKDPDVRRQARRTKSLIDEALAGRTGPQTPGDQIGDMLARDLASKGSIIGKTAYDLGRTIARNLRAGVQGTGPVAPSGGGGGGGGGGTVPRQAVLHEGTHFVPFDQSAFLQRGEIVVPAPEASAIRAGTAVLGTAATTNTTTIGDIHVDARGATNPQAVGQAVADHVAAALREQTARLPVGTRA